MARIPLARDARTERPGRAGAVLAVCFGLAMIFMTWVAFRQSTGSEAAQRDVLDGGELPGDPLGTAQAILILGGIPLLICVVVAVLVFLPDIVRGPRYRPSRGWSGGATWFAGPADAERAVADARPGARTKGGARGSW